MSTSTKRLLSLVFLLALLGGIFGCAASPGPEEETKPTWEETREELSRDLQDLQEMMDSLRREVEKDTSEVETIVSTYGVDAGLARPVVEAARRHGLDPQLLARLVQVESSWRPEVISYAGAIGLTQVRLPTARIYNPHIQVRDLQHPEIAADVGAWYLARLLDRYDGDLRRALRAYNAGPTRIRTDHRISARYAATVQGRTK